MHPGGMRQDGPNDLDTVSQHGEQHSRSGRIAGGRQVRAVVVPASLGERSSHRRIPAMGRVFEVSGGCEILPEVDHEDSIWIGVSELIAYISILAVACEGCCICD